MRRDLRDVRSSETGKVIRYSLMVILMSSENLLSESTL